MGGTRLTQDEVIKAMQFCSAVVAAPTTPAMHEEVTKRLPNALTDSSAPILLPDDVARVVDEADEDAIHVVRKINARKAVHKLYDVDNYFTQEALCGVIPCIKRGELGLVKRG